jgi:hypothetical protein
VTETVELVGLFRFGVEVVTTGEPVVALRVQGTIDGTSWRDLMQLSGPGIYYSAGDTPYPIKGLRLNLLELDGGTGAISLTASLIAAEAQR